MNKTNQVSEIGFVTMFWSDIYRIEGGIESIQIRMYHKILIK